MSARPFGRKLLVRLAGACAAVGLLVAAVPAEAQHSGGFHGAAGFHGGGFHGGWGHGWGGRGWWGGWGWGIGWGWGWPYWGWPGYYYPYYSYPAYYPPYYPAYPAPQAPPPARAPAAQHSYNVFFNFDKSDITPAAATVIQQAADAARQSGVTRLYVTGHTDTAGTSPYNQALSERRAESVRRQLIADGVPANEITTSGAGKGGQLVPTGDQVREPQNRRVEIILGTGPVSSAAPEAPASGVRTVSYTQAAGGNCRDFQRMIVIDGQTHLASGSECQMDDGSWRIVR